MLFDKTTIIKTIFYEGNIDRFSTVQYFVRIFT